MAKVKDRPLRFDGRFRLWLALVASRRVPALASEGDTFDPKFDSRSCRPSEADQRHCRTNARIHRPIGTHLELDRQAFQDRSNGRRGPAMLALHHSSSCPVEELQIVTQRQWQEPLVARAK